MIRKSNLGKSVRYLVFSALNPFEGQNGLAEVTSTAQNLDARLTPITGNDTIITCPKCSDSPELETYPFGDGSTGNYY